MSILHAHRWGHPWIDNLHIFPLSASQQNLLFRACESLDSELLFNDPDFQTTLLSPIDKCIQEAGPCFFKLSSAAPKDSDYKDAEGPALRATSANRLFRVFVRSFRMMEELEDPGDFALILTPWNDNVDPKIEHRCFIVDGKLEAVQNMFLAAPATPAALNSVQRYLQARLASLPQPTLAMDLSLPPNSEPIFVEFNPLDSELDTYGLDLLTTTLRCQTCLATDPTD